MKNRFGNVDLILEKYTNVPLSCFSVCFCYHIVPFLLQLLIFILYLCVTDSRQVLNLLVMVADKYLGMAAKALQNLPVSDRNIDCKAVLTKPCVAKMNGKTSPQISVTLDHNGVEVEKPEAERVIVEIEYIESKDLDNVAEVDAVLKVSSIVIPSF